MARIDGLRREGSRYFMQAWQLYPLLKERGLMACKSRLRDEGGETWINGVHIAVQPVAIARESARLRRKRFGHRVFASCDCGRMIPFGRLGQHRKSCNVNVFEGE